jgi:hypothetical protein
LTEPGAAQASAKGGLEMADIRSRLSADARWTSFVAPPLVIVALVITMLWLVADEFGAPVSSRWPQRDHPTTILRLLFRN